MSYDAEEAVLRDQHERMASGDVLGPAAPGVRLMADLSKSFSFQSPPRLLVGRQSRNSNETDLDGALSQSAL